MKLKMKHIKKHALFKLSSISRYASSQTCRHKQISRYFENELESCKTACDNCTQDDIKTKDITKFSQMFFVCYL